MRKYLSSALVVVVAGSFLFGCGKKPAAVVEQFYTRVAAGKVNDAFGLMSKESAAMLSAIGGSAALMQMTNEIQQKKGIKKLDVVSQEINGDTAEVKFKITFGDGSVKSDNERLIKEDGGWRIVASK